MDDVVIKLDYSDRASGDTVTLSDDNGDERVTLLISGFDGYCELNRYEARELADALMAWVKRL